MKNNKRKAFTLIEILAVIIILGVLMLIAVPSVTEYISNSRKKSFLSSASNILDNAKRYVIANSIDEGKAFTISNGSFSGDGFDVRGKLPTNGTISVNKYMQTSLAVTDGSWCAKKTYSDSEIIVTRDDGDCSIENIEYTAESCFAFNTETGVIMDYYDHQENNEANPECPTDVVIPFEINGVTVRSIGPGAFITVPTTQHCENYSPYQDNLVDLYYIHTEDDGYDECSFYMNWSNIGRLTSAVIPDTVTNIYYDAFKNNQLNNLVIGNNVTNIGFMSFYSNQLPSLTLPNSVISIGGWAFEDNQLTSVTIPNSVVSIAEEAFYENQLTTVDIPDSVTTIGEWAFYYNQLTSVTIPNSITTLSEGVFSDNQLTSIDIPSSITSIGDWAFEYNQITDLNIPSSVQYLSGFNNNKLESVSIPNTVTTLGTEAFEKNLLTSITIPSSITSIGGDAFAGNLLTSVTIPNNVTSIGYGAFQDNSDLSVIYIDHPRDYASNMSNFSTKWGASDAGIVCAGETVYQITTDNDNAALPTMGIPDSQVVLKSKDINQMPTSFKLNGVTTVGYRFIMPSSNVNITDITFIPAYVLESTHTYSNNFNYTWTQTIPGASSVAALFDKKTSTEAGYDFIYIYDKNDNLIGTYDGSDLSNQELVITGDTIKIRLVSDAYATSWGFKCQVFQKN